MVVLNEVDRLSAGEEIEGFLHWHSRRRWIHAIRDTLQVLLFKYPNHRWTLIMSCPAGKTTDLYTSEAEAYCPGLKVYAVVVLYASAVDRLALRRPLTGWAESSLFDCGCDVKNDRAGGCGGYVSSWQR